MADLRVTTQNRLWKAGLTPQRPPQQRQALALVEYPDWQIRVHQTQRWHLWALYNEAQAESPDPSGHFALITVDRRDDRALVTFNWALLEAWLQGQRPFVIPRRKRRAGFSHHRQFEQIGPCAVPLLVSRQVGRPVLVSVPLDVFKVWLEAFPAPRHQSREEGDQLSLSLWSAQEDATA